MDTVVFERGDKMYLVGPVAPFQPGEKEIEEFAFAESLRAKAPNQNLVWMRGQYVESDRPNLNGALWTADEIAIKSLTPMFMPVTVMHDPRTAVGLIADTKLLTPETASVDRSRIDTTLGLWGHRFPEVIEEAAANYEAGTLMQSMECHKGYYDCGECGQRFPVLPGGAEEKNWCVHLRGETGAANGKPTRRLGNVTFTGTGLIFGTRGAKGAFQDAGLDVFQDEVAEFHERAHAAPDRHRPRRKRTMEIEQKDYEALVARAGRVDEVEKQLGELADVKETAAKVPELESNLEKAEIAKVAAEKERDEAKTKVTEHEEAASAATLASERLGKLGKGFVEKLGDVKTALDEQAKTMSDEDWSARIEELAKLTGVKSDEGGTETDENAGGGGADGEFTADEVARSGAGAGTRPGNGEGPSPEARRSVVRGLVHPPKAAAKS